MVKEYYYKDELTEDFAATNGKIGKDVVDGTYRYSRNSIGWKIISFIVYRIFVTPLVWAYVKLWLGITVKNRKALKGLKGLFTVLHKTQKGSCKKSKILNSNNFLKFPLFFTFELILI